MKSHPSLINEESKQIWKAVLFAPERCNLYNQKNMNPECPRPWAYRPQCLSELLNVHIFYIQYILTNTRIRSPPRARPSCRRENVTTQGSNLRLASKCQTKNNVYHTRQLWLSPRLDKSHWWWPLHGSPRFHLERGWETRTNGPTRPPTKSRPSIHHSSALTWGASRPAALPTTPYPLRMWSKEPPLHPHHQSVHVVHKRNVIHLAKTNDCFSQGM